MKLLAIDSSGLVASVALLYDDILVGEYTIHNKKTHSQTLLPMIDELIRIADTDKHELDAIAVAAGPGSFTGLRIGAATAKGLAQALGIPIVPVSTLEGLSYNLQGSKDFVCPIMDARRSQVYACLYDVSDEEPRALIREDAYPIDELKEAVLKNKGDRVIFLGDGVPVYEDWLRDIPGVVFASDAVRYQRASSVAALGRLYAEQGKAVPAKDFAPVYLRKSQAEREREEKR